jgi:hypothetical protein
VKAKSDGKQFTDATVITELPKFDQPLYCDGEKIDNGSGIWQLQHNKSGTNLYYDHGQVLPYSSQITNAKYYYLISEHITDDQIDKIVDIACRYSKDGHIIYPMLLYMCRANVKHHSQQQIEKQLQVANDQDMKSSLIREGIKDFELYLKRLLKITIKCIEDSSLDVQDLDRLTWGLNNFSNEDGDKYYNKDGIKQRKAHRDILLRGVPPEKKAQVIQENKILHSIRYMLNSQQRYVCTRDNMYFHSILIHTSYLSTCECNNSKDQKTKAEYEQLNLFLPTNECVLLLFRQYTFAEVYEIIARKVIVDGGLESQHAETFLSFTLVDVIKPVRDLTLVQHVQVLHKKAVIAIQEFDNKCHGIGEDIHFYNQSQNFVHLDWEEIMKDCSPTSLELGSKIKSKKLDFSILLSRRMHTHCEGGVAYIANEIPGQVQQLINSSKPEQRKVGLAISKELVTTYPTTYDSLINQCMVRKVHWSQRQRENFNSPQRSKLQRKCKREREATPPKPIRVTKKRRKKKAPTTPQSPEQVYQLSEYEMLRKEKVQRNLNKLKELGF